MARKETKVSDIKKIPTLYRKRMTGETVKLQDSNVEFDVIALPGIVIKYCRENSTDENGIIDIMKLTDLMVSFGVKEVRGMEDEDSNPVVAEKTTITIFNKEFPCLLEDFVDGLYKPLKESLRETIGEMSGFGDGEAIRLNFITASAS